ncbi:hypothetical protein [Sphingopyxis flava]|uniref:Uncharacterized protein n=1 Tax=Sphingopyxis flava TaxID=1507287 RepID=A0A1T5CRJ5_9SPHN|nr:hypothetical protein [Sphingopyxis flava]SKB61976.1 hypothetical protein SAMN06295937_101148 [Sphingopyxis flava]
MFSVLTSKIFGATTLALLMLLTLQTCRADRLADELEDQKVLTKSWKDAQKTTKQSLDDVIAALAEKNAESRERAKKLDAAKLKAEADAKRNAEAYRSTQQKIDALLRTRGTSTCVTPGDVREALAGI